MGETGEAAQRRMRMRSWRRGMKEMDLILGPFADARLAGLPEATLALYDALLAESDGELIGWLLGRTPPPAGYAALVAEIAAFARDRLLPKI